MSGEISPQLAELIDTETRRLSAVGLTRMEIGKQIIAVMNRARNEWKTNQNPSDSEDVLSEPAADADSIFESPVPSSDDETTSIGNNDNVPAEVFIADDDEK